MSKSLRFGQHGLAGFSSNVYSSSMCPQALKSAAAHVRHINRSPSCAQGYIESARASGLSPAAVDVVAAGVLWPVPLYQLTAWLTVLARNAN